MSTKSKARQARRHPPEELERDVSQPHSLRGQDREAAGEIAGAVLNLVTLGAINDDDRVD